MDLLATQLELNSMRNTLLGLSQYSACLTAGCLPTQNKWRENLLNLYARISLCRTVNRTLDYVSCLSRVRKYGLGRNDPTSSSVARCLTISNHLCDLIYYPSEFIAWLLEANVFGPNRSSRPFRLTSVLCWLANIIVSIIGNTIKLLQYRKILRTQKKSEDTSGESKSSTSIVIEIYKCILTLTNNVCFLVNCIHWLAIPGILWSGKLPVFLVGLCGTLATVCNMLKMKL